MRCAHCTTKLPQAPTLTTSLLRFPHKSTGYVTWHALVSMCSEWKHHLTHYCSLHNQKLSSGLAYFDDNLGVSYYFSFVRRSFDWSREMGEMRGAPDKWVRWGILASGVCTLRHAQLDRHTEVPRFNASEVEFPKVTTRDIAARPSTGTPTRSGNTLKITIWSYCGFGGLSWTSTRG